LENNNDGQHGYKWDGTYLRSAGALIHYGSINHSPTNSGKFGLASNTRELAFNADYFPHLLSQITAGATGGQTVYLHLPTWNGGFHHTNESFSNALVPKPLGQAQSQKVVVPQPGTAAVMPKPLGQAQSQKVVVPQPGTAAVMPKPLGQAQSQKVVVPQPGTAAVMPKPLGQAQSQKVVVPKGIPPTNRPKAISLIFGQKNKQGTKIDKTTVNGHFITTVAGSLVKQEERAYLLDHNNDLWSCKVSGLGARTMPNEKGEQEFVGHVETLKFRSDRLGHIPGNHPMHRGCLISVQQ
jgi:hypothetical protein